MRLARALAALALLLSSACGGDEDEPWRWVPIAGTACSDGSQTGIGVELGPGSDPDVLVFLMGGGACWDTLSCYTFATATPGPYGAAQLDAEIAALRPGSILDRSLDGNPYKDFTFVFVPYCTGDVHAGDTVQTYPGAPGGRAWHHKGRVNVQRAFEWLAQNLPAPAKVVVSGASAGGFGALLAFDRAKQAWPDAKGYLVDDSGPPIAAIPDATVGVWEVAWDFGTPILDLCGLDCLDSLAPLLPALAAKYPADRFALLSSSQDEVMRSFFATFTTRFPFFEVMDPQVFEDSLRALAGGIDDDTPEEPPGETHAFLVTGDTHPMLDRPADFTSGGVALLEWLRRMVEDEAGWASAIAPASPQP